MIKIKIKLDEQKIDQEKKYTSKQVYSALDKLFSTYNFQKEISSDYTITYLGNNKNTDFGAFANIILFLKKQDWTEKYFTKWLWYNSDDGVNDNDFVIEDILEFYFGRKSN